MQQIVLRLAVGQVNHRQGRLCILAKKKAIKMTWKSEESFCFCTLSNRMQRPSSTPDWVSSSLTLTPSGLGRRQVGMLHPGLDGSERKQQMDLATLGEGGACSQQEQLEILLALLLKWFSFIVPAPLQRVTCG